jgi:hypothetical protein
MSEGGDGTGGPSEGDTAGDDAAGEASADSGESAKFRCAWCGKPQTRNDPPCDNCGHHKFERAVVPAAPDPGEDYQREPVWVCPECGRTHQKNSPPCRRCGNATLERHVPTDEDYAEELAGTSYLDILEPRYVAGFAVAFVGLAALVLAAAGVITLPGMGGGDLTVTDVPGSGEEIDGVALADVETAYLDAIDERRTDAGREAFERVDRLDAVSRFATQRRVKAVYGDGQPASGDRIVDATGDACGTDEVTLRLYRAEVDSGGQSAEDIAAALVGQVTARDSTPVGADGTLTGVDVHAGPDGRVFLTQLVC